MLPAYYFAPTPAFFGARSVQTHRLEGFRLPGTGHRLEPVAPSTTGAVRLSNRLRFPIRVLPFGSPLTGSNALDESTDVPACLSSPFDFPLLPVRQRINSLPIGSPLQARFEPVDSPFH